VSHSWIGAPVAVLRIGADNGAINEITSSTRRRPLPDETPFVLQVLKAAMIKEKKTPNIEHRMEESAICNLSPLTSLVTAASGNPSFGVRRSMFGVRGRGRRGNLVVASSRSQIYRERPLTTNWRKIVSPRCRNQPARRAHSARLRAGSAVPGIYKPGSRGNFA